MPGLSNALARVGLTLAAAPIFLIDLVFPRDDRLWVFAVGRDAQWQGNPQAVYEQARRVPGLRLAVLAARATPSGLDPTTRVVAGRSLAAVWLLLRAGVVVIHHGTADLRWRGLTGRRRILLNVWHGIPLKGIMLTNKETSPPRLAERTRRECARYSFVIASSEVDRIAMAASMGLHLERIWVTGLPRNDYLLGNQDALPASVAEAERAVRERLGGSRLVLYAPTHRAHSNGAYDFAPAQTERLCALLQRHGAVLGLRIHMNSEAADSLQPGVIPLSPAEYPDTQALLRATDVLLTDYSSIWIDYLLLERPAICFAHDLEEYLVDRGLLYPLEEVFPGPIARTVDELLAELDSALSGTSGKERGLAALRLFHTYTDGRSAARVLERVLEASG
jgi:CDP-glycerol glycerophosphotransferase